jgi:hypothetical protein
MRASSEVDRWQRTGALLPRFTGAEMALVLARTHPAMAAVAVLPKPLQGPKDPVVSAFVAHYPETNFGMDYCEGAWFVEGSTSANGGSTARRFLSTTTRR